MTLIEFKVASWIPFFAIVCRFVYYIRGVSASIAELQFSFLRVNKIVVAHLLQNTFAVLRIPDSTHVSPSFAIGQVLPTSIFRIGAAVWKTGGDAVSIVTTDMSRVTPAGVI